MMAGAMLLLCGARAQDARSAPASRSRVVTDETGRRVAVPLEVNRIVSLAPSLTETIYALGLDSKLVGDTDYCDTPPAAKSKPHVGSILNPSLEAIVALHPDLVLAAANSANRRETVESLEYLGIPVYASDPHTVRGMLDSITRIADLAGAAPQGDARQGDSLVARLQARLDALHHRLADLPPAHVLFVVWEDPLITVGPNTFIADALRWAGAESVVVAQQDWPQISIEEVVRLQPDYIVLAAAHQDSSAAPSNEAQLKDFRARPVWRELRAVEAGHVIAVNDAIIRPSPALIDVIEQLARDLHPDVFDKTAAAAIHTEHPSCAL